MESDWFAGRLRELREHAGLTQKELADKAGVGLRAITYLESQDRKPTWETVIALCKALGVTCQDFMKEPAQAASETRPRGRPPKAAAPPAVPPAEELEAVREEPEKERKKTGKGPASTMGKSSRRL